jgi:hypothetical protein
MTKLRSVALLACAVATSVLVPPSSATLSQDPKQPAQDMAAMMAKAKKFTEPSKHHEVLKRFIGKWDVESRFFAGPQASPAEKGTAECSWLMEGRWIKFDDKGTMMGKPLHSFTIMGYDNFKMSYVVTTVQNMDTAMNRSEGDMDPGGKALITYGTIDEYLTGEHDKMVKYVWRFLSEDKIVLEVHDLPIGETNTKVLELTYTRQKTEK